MEAVEEACRHLLNEVRRGRGDHVVNGCSVNHKGLLLELGGTVTVSRVVGTPDHRPLFVAKAELEGRIGRGEGGNKIEAEQRAAKALVLEREDGR